MLFQKTILDDVYEIEPEIKTDERGFFSRVFCARELEDLGLDSKCVQSNRSFSRQKGTLRGMHYQMPPQSETKLVQCIKGALYDVVLDLRPGLQSFGRSIGRVLSDQNQKMLYIPKGCAHGFLTLEPNTEMLYFVSEFYEQKLERGVRWNDPFFQIEWPAFPTILSEKDQKYKDFDLPTYLASYP